ncbi:Clr5 domain-containing protein [Chaetomidium leptoderma]|uniref:Clr5 domain-containing protein n=1 Tax=Chaetomidium leptoderma TaxID=669021 RepID=A0AAN6VP39_9PEZI|nr:Clr5 domain-containing protein [Chaetomidium leptoderma]
MPAPSESQPNWATHRSKIEDLYWTHGKELPEVMETLKNEYGFVASPKMYKKRFKAWGLQKNLSTDESMAMCQIDEQRRIVKNKKTLFLRRGKLVEPGKLRRFRKRHKLMADGGSGTLLDTRVATPPNITYTTPEPSPSNNSLPPAALPYPDPDTSEGDQGAMEDSPVSYKFDSDGSPLLSGNLPEAPPSSWFSDGAYPSSQRPTHTVTTADFISDAFSGHQLTGAVVPHHGLSGDGMGHSFGPWLDPTDPPPHGYHGPANEIIPSFVFSQPPPQEVHSLAYGLDRDPPAFPSDCSPSVGHAMLGSNTFGSTSPTDPINTIPGAASDALGHTMLHDAVVDNNLDLVRTLLAGGANPNCTARGGWWDSCHRFSAALIAEEMVRLCQEMGVLDGLLLLAEQKRKENVLKLLLGAKRQLAMRAVSHVAGGP